MSGRILTSLLTVLALAAPAGAGAHVRVQPEQAAAGAYTVLRVNVPNESADLTTTRVEVRFPQGFSYAFYQPVAGWSVDVRLTKAAKSAITGKTIPAHVSRVIWRAQDRRAEIQPEQFEDFPIAVQIPARPGDTLRFKALQTYEDGDVVRWVGGPGSPTPAPQVLVTAADEERGAAASEDEPAEEDSGGDSDGLAIAALIVAILGLAAGGAALVGSVRARRASGKTNEGSQMATQTKVISGTDFITVATQDYERAARFYGETLGLEFSKRWGSMPAGEFETGNLTIALMQSDAFGIEFRPNNHPIEFHVDDFETAKAELESRGVEFKGDTLDSGVCHQAFFNDPDGNALAIHHRYAPADPAS
jgi:periplasmic copper chaperone A